MKRDVIQREMFSKRQLFLVFQIAQLLKIGRVVQDGSLYYHMCRESSKFVTPQSELKFNSLDSIYQTFLLKEHRMKIWLAESASFLHKMHKLGPIHPLFSIFFHVSNLSFTRIQLKHFNFYGIFHFHNFQYHQLFTGLQETDIKASYANFAVIFLEFLFHSHTILSSTLHSLIPTELRKLMYMSHNTSQILVRPISVKLTNTHLLAPPIQVF